MAALTLGTAITAGSTYILNRSILDKDSSGRSVGMAVFECAKADSTTLKNQLIQTLFPGQSSTPPCRRARIESDRPSPGHCLVTARYSDYFRRFHPAAGTAYFYMSGLPKMTKLKKKGTQVLDGVDETDPTRWWRVTKGSPFVIEGKAMAMIRVGLASPPANRWLATYLSKVGKINSDDLPYMGLVAGQALFLKPVVRHKIAAGELWYVNFYFLINLDGWNNDIQTTKGSMIAQQTVVLDVNNNPITGASRTFLAWWPKSQAGVAGTVENVAPYSTTTLADIDTLLGGNV